MIALFRLCVALFVSPFKSKSRLEAENAAVCTDAAWAQEHSLHRAGAGSAQEFLEVTMATPGKPKRDLFASAEDDLKSNSGGHYLKDCAQHLARLLSPSSRSVPVGSG